MAKTSLTPDSEETDAWLSLGEACKVLGVHPTTLRSWADKGHVRTFRTPGGHRRFSAVDLHRFLEVGRSPSPAQPDPSARLWERALSTARRGIASLGPTIPDWHDQFDETDRVLKRESGRQLLALSVHYAVSQLDRAEILDEVRQISRAYGVDAAQRGLRVADVARLVCLFRNALLKATLRNEVATLQDAYLRQDLEYFMDEVLFAMLAGHEEANHGQILTGEQLFPGR